MALARHRRPWLALVLALQCAGCPGPGGHHWATGAGDDAFLARAATAPGELTHEELVQRLAPEAPPAAQLAALRILQERGRGTVEIASLLAADGVERSVRLTAVGCLAALAREGNAEALAALRAFLKAEADPMRRWSLQVIEEYGVPELRPGLEGGS